jgi:hypothetical protein
MVPFTSLYRYKLSTVFISQKPRWLIFIIRNKAGGIKYKTDNTSADIQGRYFQDYPLPDSGVFVNFFAKDVIPGRNSVMEFPF